jgi:hypothetical protein
MRALQTMPPPDGACRIEGTAHSRHDQRTHENEQAEPRQGGIARNPPAGAAIATPIHRTAASPNVSQ